MNNTSNYLHLILAFTAVVLSGLNLFLATKSNIRTNQSFTELSKSLYKEFMPAIVTKKSIFTAICTAIYLILKSLAVTSSLLISAYILNYFFNTARGLQITILNTRSQDALVFSLVKKFK